MTSELAHIARTPLEIAAEWFARKRSGQMSAHELRELQAWLDADAEHDFAFRRIAQTWEITRAIATDPEMLAIREDARNHHPARVRMLNAAGIGLASLIALGLAGWFAMSTDIIRDLFTKPYERQFETAIGEVRTVKLADGSIVTLDTGTLMHVRETAGRRTIALLRGQAFFRVAKDVSRPFVVSAGGNDVTAVGTVFDVRVDPDRFKVTLVEGRVIVAAPASVDEDQRTAMIAGWQLTAWSNGERMLAPVSLTAEAHETGWLDGRLTFIATRIGDVAGEMNRYSKKKIIVDSAVSTIPIDGVFKTGDVGGFVRLVTAYGFARVVSDTETEIILGAVRKRSHHS
jgi:transmembrane sensor